MTTPSGTIRASDIRNEFGSTSGSSVSLGGYRISQNVGTLSNLPLDSGVPQSGSISFNNLRGKRLNIVVDLYSIPDYSTRLTARSRYDNNNVTVIGGFAGKPGSSSGKRVIINVNKIIGSSQGNQTDVALRTGGWESDTQLEMEIGSSAIITGAGGNGGPGATSEDDNPSSPGQAGSSGLGIEYPTTIRNSGYIQSGHGGGGGGALAVSQGNCGRTQRSCQGCRVDQVFGGGGAGGRGYPYSSGGGSSGNGGSGGSLTDDGSPGSGYTLRAGECNRCTQYGSSGNGGSAGNSGDGSAGCSRTYSNQGSGGPEGFAIIYNGGGTSSSFTNNGGSFSGPTSTSVSIT